ncbi:MAG: chalcone isomerase family protein [Tepidimonas sp.]|uniref:chalcone isomerase family protein n=1 Tax=Tepidimonas sp. TaxID=2002775 RepID=UPI004054B746
MLAAVLASLGTRAGTAAPLEAPASPRAVPDSVGVLLPGAEVVGGGTLRFPGLPVYQAQLFAAPGWRANTLGRTAVVLELTYLRGFTGTDIARRSLEEMRRAGPLEAADEAVWLDTMERLFPDVRPGDRIAGLWQPGWGARFVLTRPDGQSRALGDVADARFAERFFGIWLAPTTSEPGLRQALLGPTATTDTP